MAESMTLHVGRHSRCGCRAAIAKIKAAIGDDTVPVTTAGTNDSSDAADVVPAECESPADSRKAGKHSTTVPHSFIFWTLTQRVAQLCRRIVKISRIYFIYQCM